MAAVPKVLASQLLELNGISDKNARLISVGSNQWAADLLLGGDLDVAVFVSTHRASYVLPLLTIKIGESGRTWSGLKPMHSPFHYLYVY
jgi:TRAP-type uncharacterized transport system substrate-binding protein